MRESSVHGVVDRCVRQVLPEEAERQLGEGVDVVERRPPRDCVYASRFTSASGWNSIAVFGDAGEAPWSITNKMSGRIALVDAGLIDLIEDHPKFLGAKIVPTPPPLKK